MALSVDDVIQRVGGIEPAAELTGVSTDAVRKWRQARAIPTRHWPKLIAATGLTLGELPGAAPVAGPEAGAPPAGATAVLVLADGAVFWGRGFGAFSTADRVSVGEVCFNTAMSGYQETLTDPSYAGQI
ncbi:MAG: carph-isopro domain-containing protein, partial [Acetobacteraceae bacterium]